MVDRDDGREIMRGLDWDMLELAETQAAESRLRLRFTTGRLIDPARVLSSIVNTLEERYPDHGSLKVNLLDTSERQPRVVATGLQAVGLVKDLALETVDKTKIRDFAVEWGNYSEGYPDASFEFHQAAPEDGKCAFVDLRIRPSAQLPIEPHIILRRAGEMNQFVEEQVEPV